MIGAQCPARECTLAIASQLRHSSLSCANPVPCGRACMAGNGDWGMHCCRRLLEHVLLRMLIGACTFEDID